MTRVIMLIFIYLMLSGFTSAKSSNSSYMERYCKAIYKRYDINPYIKNNKGWSRVCKNGKVFKYSDEMSTVEDITEVCNCLTTIYGIDTSERDISYHKRCE